MFHLERNKSIGVLLADVCTCRVLEEFISHHIYSSSGRTVGVAFIASESYQT